MNKKDEQKILKMEKLRHSTSHVMAQAVLEMFPEAKIAIGPAIENGFYYDFELPRTLTNEDLEKIESKMKELAKKDCPFTEEKITKEQAEKLFKNQLYKLELIRDLFIKEKNPALSIYRHADFYDLCKGPHIENVNRINPQAIKLLSTSGAYWRGDEKRPMLQRIYGTVWPDKKGLVAYLTQLEEAKKRDHNKLGREMELFTTSDLVGQGLPLLAPKGAKIKQILQRFVEDEEEKRGYQLTMTPFMAKSDLYKVSGHWDHYKDGMFILKSGEQTLALRPMTCPFQFQIYNSKQRSYKDLPIRYNETATLFRNETSGEMHGLIRVRQFTLSEGHIICRPDQLEEEFRNVLDLLQYLMGIIGIKEDVWYQFSKWDPANKEKYIDNPKAWEESQKQMKQILDHLKLDYVEADGEAAFYGPKLDVQFKNVHGKEDTLLTIQIDFALPERFGMTYIDKDNKKKTPMVIHRASLGCYERTIAMLIEKYAGHFPFWIAPVQVKLISIKAQHMDYVRKIALGLKAAGIRYEIDARDERMQAKIRDAQLEKVPYMLIIGDKEKEENKVSIRTKSGKNINGILLETFLEVCQKQIAEKSIEISENF
jgi:threonyl-tRNA synthetase